MHDQDHASLLISQHQPLDASRTHLDASLFDRIGNGLADSLLMVPIETSPHQHTPPKDDVLQRLCALADRIEQAFPSQGSSSTTAAMQGQKAEQNPFDVQTNAPLGLDLRALDILQPTIFHSFWTGARPDMEDPTLSQKVDSPKEPPHFPAITSTQGVDYDRWSSRTVFGALSHPAAVVDTTRKQQNTIIPFKTTLSKNKLQEFDIVKEAKTGASQPLTTFTQTPVGRRASGEDDVGVVFELPALTKRPRDILDDCFDRESPRLLGSSIDDFAMTDDDTRKRKAVKLDPKDTLHLEVDMEKGQAQGPKDLNLWLSASRRSTQNDTQKLRRYDQTREDARPLFSQLSWETCSRTGLPSSLSSVAGTGTVSPYVTEAGLPIVASLFRRFVQ